MCIIWVKFVSKFRIYQLQFLMQERHVNTDQYISEQVLTTEKYVIPYINNVIPVSDKLVVAEIGCGQGGNLKPFLDMGCKVIGIDISKSKIDKARVFFSKHPLIDNVTLIESDIYDIQADIFKNVGLVIMRDTLEHIPHQEVFLKHLNKILKPKTKVFIGFPPWCMPFAGHQQVCKSRFLSKLPYFHLFPGPLYRLILKMFGEDNDYIVSLQEIKDTRIGINRFRRIALKNNFVFLKQDLFLINPNYEIKFKLKPRLLPKALDIPYIRDFFTTTYYSVIEKI